MARKNKDRLPNIVKVVALTDTIMGYFHNTVKGISSEFAYFELLSMVEAGFEDVLNMKKTAPVFDHVDFMFGIEYKKFNKILKDYNKRIKSLELQFFGV